jgi:catechol 2,3-dioxygenase-like lactoylglutathione lyase family enzyme
MPIIAVHHINIATTKLEATRAFFVDVLGLLEGPRPEFPSTGYWLYARGVPVVHMQQSETPVGPSNLSALNHAAFQVADFDAAVARLQRHGVSFDLATIPGTALRQAFFLDPNGVRLEFNEVGDADRRDFGGQGS